MLRDVFGFAEHEEKATYGLRYEVTLTINSDNSVLNEDNGINICQIKVISIEWYVPHYPPIVPQLPKLSKQILSEVPPELQYVERVVFLKEANTQNLGTFK